MERMTLSGTLFTTVTSFVREEMNQLTSKMSLKSLHNKQINLLSSKTNKDDEFTQKTDKAIQHVHLPKLVTCHLSNKSGDPTRVQLKWH